MVEAQHADQKIQQIIAELVVEKAWSLDQALHEVTHIRADLAVLLQPRPKIVKRSLGVQIVRTPERENMKRAMKERQRQGQKQRWKERKRKKHVDHRIAGQWSLETAVPKIPTWAMQLSRLQIPTSMCLSSP